MLTGALSDFSCPSCGTMLAAQAHQLGCPGCKAEYAIVEGVPLLLPGLKVRTAKIPNNLFVEEISRIAVPAAEASAHEPMRALFSKQFDFPDPQLATEGERFLHRLRSSGFNFRNPDGSMPEAEAIAPASFPEGPPSVRLKLSTVPASVVLEQEFWVQVRIFNTGKTLISATGPNALRLSYSTARPFRPLLRGEIRTQLLIDLPPGYAITQPVRIKGPAALGTRHYQITPVLGEASWLDDAAIPIKVEAIATLAPDPQLLDWSYSETVRDYGEDHQRGFSLLQDWLVERFADKSAIRVLEVGGNAAPMLAAAKIDIPNARFFNLDIDPFGLVFGTLQRRLGGGFPVQDLVGDGMNLPFADESLDAIVMFATLHHFPDPAGFLSRLRRKLTPDGLICVLCEPIAHVTRENLPGDFKEELLAGICEQAFEPWEWSQFFTNARLRPAHVFNDRGSLKVALEKDESLGDTIPLIPQKRGFARLMGW